MILVETEQDTTQPTTSKHNEIKTIATRKTPNITNKNEMVNINQTVTPKKVRTKSLANTKKSNTVNVHDNLQLGNVIKNNSKENNKQQVTAVNTLDSIEAIKIQEVVAEIQHLKNTKNLVTDSEIDSLLNLAQKDLVNEKLFNTTTNTVNADALLEAVEDDIQKSFRTKVFEALKTNYKKVKTAVAERNN